jgi:hypothetical protein
MKLLVIFLLSAVFVSASAQTDSRIFFSQLMVVFSDLDKNFEYLKGDLKETAETDTLFESTIALEGTRDNTILRSQDVNAYQALISDSTSAEGAQFIMKAWKEKLTNVLTGSFSRLGEAYRSEDNAAITGWEFASDRVSVLLLQHKTEEGWYWINLVIRSR